MSLQTATTVATALQDHFVSEGLSPDQQWWNVFENHPDAPTSVREFIAVPDAKERLIYILDGMGMARVYGSVPPLADTILDMWKLWYATPDFNSETCFHCGRGPTPVHQHVPIAAKRLKIALINHDCSLSAWVAANILLDHWSPNGPGLMWPSLETMTRLYSPYKHRSSLSRGLEWLRDHNFIRYAEKDYRKAYPDWEMPDSRVYAWTKKAQVV